MHLGVAERLCRLHDEIRSELALAGLSRIAIALYDERSDILKTFIHSSLGTSPLEHVSARLSEMPTLGQLAATGARRVINDLNVPALAGQEHAMRLVASGYRSSYTVPIVHKGNFYGFLFFNAPEPGFFVPVVVQMIRPYADLIAMAVMRELDTVRMMRAAVRVFRQVSTARDEETGSHLARMARYARLIAAILAGQGRISDEFVEFIFQFCPLHDVGKIAVPDSILLKPGPLTPDEYETMKIHVERGVEMIDMMKRDFNLEGMAHFDMLRNIVAHHHETLDGSGYPKGISGDRIPIEARIAAVADVFDALTSSRPYKKAWSNEDALAHLKAKAGSTFDAECVAALESQLPSILEIQARFAENPFD